MRHETQDSRYEVQESPVSSLKSQVFQSIRRRPRKRLGQNFLVDSKVLDAIVEAAELSSEDMVLEIGAGTGVLTERLALSSGKLVAVELDEGLFRILQSNFQGISNVNLIHGSILDLDFSTLMDAVMSSKPATVRIKVIGNLPYYITTPILMKVLEASSAIPIQMILVMVQAEVGMRMTASPGTKDYGALSIAIAYRSDAEILKYVPAGSFYPKPKVDSVLVRLNVRSAPPVEVRDEKLFFQIVRAGFQYRRKTLRNALLMAIHSGELRLPANSIEPILRSVSLDHKRRGETLSFTEFADLANAIIEREMQDVGC